MRYLPYDDTFDVPNVVVDGSPNAGTVLTLTHWPGIAQPAGLEADLSAQMALAFARRGEPAGADVVTNNHFDQDGLVAMFALIEPEAALGHADLLADVAAAGDFATFGDRRAARASMAIATYADPQRSPIAADLTGPYPQQCALLYDRLLGQLLDIVLHPDRFAELWRDEDGELAASEAALSAGAITIEERPELDLAIVDIDGGQRSRSGHRFAADEYVGAHPMAIHNATGCFRILQVHDGRSTYTDRYETWVQYRSRRPLPRVDLRPLAAELDSVDPGGGWSASPPSSLTPQLTASGVAGLDRATVVEHLVAYLVAAPPAWDPYAVGS